jgi:hypothetical protein
LINKVVIIVLKRYVDQFRLFNVFTRLNAKDNERNNMKKMVYPCLLPLLLSSLSYANSGKVDIHFNSVYAVYSVGDPDFNAKDNAYCQNNIGSQYLDKPISIEYTIEPKSMFQTSNINYLNSRIQLHPEGLTDRYAFMSDDVGALKQNKIFRVIANFDKALQIASSFVMFKTDQGFNCVLMGVAPV